MGKFDRHYERSPWEVLAITCALPSSFSWSYTATGLRAIMQAVWDTLKGHIDQFSSSVGKQTTPSTASFTNPCINLKCSWGGKEKKSLPSVLMINIIPRFAIALRKVFWTSSLSFLLVWSDVRGYQCQVSVRCIVIWHTRRASVVSVHGRRAVTET